MTFEDWADQLFSRATGWLHWPPELALNTPMGQIELALEGVVEFAKITNPFGSGEDKEGDMLKLPPAPELAAQQLMGFVKRKQAHDMRHKKKR